jgi:hypothetical protein
VQFQHYSLHCFGISVELQNLVKIKGVPSLFFSSLRLLTLSLKT